MSRHGRQDKKKGFIMGFRIQTNVAAMNAHKNSLMTNKAIDNSLNALSSGRRINKAADDASGMAIANKLRQQAQGLGQAITNANDGIGVSQVADGAIEEYTKIIDTIRTKAIQAASDGQSLDSRVKIQADISRLTEEAQNIAATTSFNGQTLLNGAFKDKAFHIGAYAGETVNISIDDTQVDKVGKFAMVSGTTGITAATAGSKAGTALADATISVTVTKADKSTSTVTATAHHGDGAHSSKEMAQDVVDAFNTAAQTKGTAIRASVFLVDSKTSKYGVRLDSGDGFTTTKDGGDTLGSGVSDLKKNLGAIDVTTRDGAEKAIITTDYALKDLDAIRSDIGSTQNQLESTIRNISVTQVNITAAESQIRDVDFAAESATFSKLNILAQSGTYAMSQANAVQKNVMKLLQ
jgi:flagellin